MTNKYFIVSDCTTLRYGCNWKCSLQTPTVKCVSMMMAYIKTLFVDLDVIRAQFLRLGKEAGTSN